MWHTYRGKMLNYWCALPRQLIPIQEHCLECSPIYKLINVVERFHLIVPLGELIPRLFIRSHGDQLFDATNLWGEVFWMKWRERGADHVVRTCALRRIPHHAPRMVLRSSVGRWWWCRWCVVGVHQHVSQPTHIISACTSGGSRWITTTCLQVAQWCSRCQRVQVLVWLTVLVRGIAEKKQFWTLTDKFSWLGVLISLNSRSLVRRLLSSPLLVRRLNALVVRWRSLRKLLNSWSDWFRHLVPGWDLIDSIWLSSLYILHGLLLDWSGSLLLHVLRAGYSDG